MNRCVIYYITVRYIVVRYSEVRYMTDRLKRIYVPMSETAFYILFCLTEEAHGYLISRRVKELTCGEVNISAGTMYGTLSKMEKDGLISFVREEDKRKLYKITPVGREILDTEIARIRRLYRNIGGEAYL
ncbi:PadR family transcriptional regulator [Ruminococcus sp. YE71]|uniref:PadR family transcriptional regulator n=2 Tax=unclassified Ruminococcus TaxID=2608920 RepID=UPI00325ACEC8